MKVILPNPEETERLAAEMLRLLVNLRDKTKKWQRLGGSVAKNNLKYWEQQADEFIDSLTQYDENSTKIISPVVENRLP